MPSIADCRSAAARYTDIHTDDPNEEEELASDEVYGTLAVARKDLEVLRKYGDDLNDDVDEAVEEALEDLREAMHKRAIQHLLGEVADD